MTERVGVYICHCGTNISGKVDVEDVSELGRRAGERGGRPRLQVHVLEPGPGPDRGGHQGTGPDAGRGGGLLAPHAREDVPDGLRAGRAQPLPVRDGQHPRAQLLDHQRTARRPRARPRRWSRGPSSGWCTTQPLELIAGGDQPRHAGGGRRYRRHLGGAGAGRRGPPRGHLVEREPSIGGHMAQLDKTFPTLDCSACILTPKMVDVAQHPNITLYTYSEVEAVDGHLGNFQVTVRKKARYVNEDHCTGCGICIEKCPFKVKDDVFEAGLGERKVDLPAVPAGRAQVPGHRHRELRLLPARQVQGLPALLPDRAQLDRLRAARRADPASTVGNIILATGFDLFDVQPDSAVRLRPAGQRVHQPRVRAPGERRRPHRRRDRAARHGDGAQDAWPSSIASARGTRTTTSTARTSAACTR